MMSLPNNDDATHDNNYFVEEIIQSLNMNKRIIFDQICAGKNVFNYGPGDPDKKYLYNAISKYLRSEDFN
jgi:hypothetical protein